MSATSQLGDFLHDQLHRLRIVIDKLGKQLNKLHQEAQSGHNLDETWNNAEALHAELAALLQTADVKRALYAALEEKSPGLLGEGRAEFMLPTWTIVNNNEITVPLPAMGTEVDDGDEGTLGSDLFVRAKGRKLEVV